MLRFLTAKSAKSRQGFFGFTSNDLERDVIMARGDVFFDAVSV